VLSLSYGISVFEVCNFPAFADVCADDPDLSNTCNCRILW
jgi:hypothetical protein